MPRYGGGPVVPAKEPFNTGTRKREMKKYNPMGANKWTTCKAFLHQRYKTVGDAEIQGALYCGKDMDKGKLNTLQRRRLLFAPIIQPEIPQNKRDAMRVVIAAPEGIDLILNKKASANTEEAKLMLLNDCWNSIELAGIMEADRGVGVSVTAQNNNADFQMVDHGHFTIDNNGKETFMTGNIVGVVPDTLRPVEQTWTHTTSESGGKFPVEGHLVKVASQQSIFKNIQWDLKKLYGVDIINPTRLLLVEEKIVAGAKCTWEEMMDDIKKLSSGDELGNERMRTVKMMLKQIEGRHRNGFWVHIVGKALAPSQPGEEIDVNFNTMIQ